MNLKEYMNKYAADKADPIHRGKAIATAATTVTGLGNLGALTGGFKGLGRSSAIGAAAGIDGFSKALKPGAQIGSVLGATAGAALAFKKGNMTLLKALAGVGAGAAAGGVGGALVGGSLVGVASGLAGSIAGAGMSKKRAMKTLDEIL